MTENPQDINPIDPERVEKAESEPTNQTAPEAGQAGHNETRTDDAVSQPPLVAENAVAQHPVAPQHPAAPAASGAPETHGGWQAPGAWPARPHGLPGQPDQVSQPHHSAAQQNHTGHTAQPSQASQPETHSNPVQQHTAQASAGYHPGTQPYGAYQQTGQHGAQVQGERTAFGTPVPGAPVYPYATASGNGSGGAGASHAGSAPEGKRRGGVKLLIAGLAIGAIVGGATGAGTYAIIASQSSGSVVNESSGPRSITINDTDDVTPTSAIAAKAAPSVVTINVAGPNAAGGGSGIVLSEDGYVLTNNHVVTLDGMLSDPTIQVSDNAGKLYTATIVGTDPVYDLAVIKLDGASGLTPMEFADSSKLNVGDVAVAIGAPLGLAGTVTDGIVSALNRSITVASSAIPDDTGDSDGDQGQSPFDFNLPGQQPGQNNQPSANISLAVIQTDAAINPGNSGGALVDAQGKLIGVNVAILGSGSSNGEQGGSIGLGFSIPSSIAERVAKEIIDNGEATHGLLGAAVKDASADASSTVVGALIDSVTPGGAAEAAGLRQGDVVTGINGLPITSSTDLTAQVRALPAGEKVELTYVRGTDSHTAEVALGTLVL